MNTKLIIIGAGGHGKVIADAAQKMNKWDELFFLDDNKIGEIILGVKVIDTVESALSYKNDFTEFIVAIGNNAAREKIQLDLQESECKMATIIHPSTNIGTEVFIGEGTVVLAGVVINASTTIGLGCIINTASSVDHDNKIGDFVHISPGTRIAGNVSVGSKSWLGINSTLINNIDVIENTMIGAGSVIIENIDEEGTYVGVPTKKIK